MKAPLKPENPSRKQPARGPNAAIARAEPPQPPAPPKKAGTVKNAPAKATAGPSTGKSPGKRIYPFEAPDATDPSSASGPNPRPVKKGRAKFEKFVEATPTDDPNQHALETKSPFADNGLHDRPLNPRDLAVGNIICTGQHDQYTDKNKTAKYEQTYVRDSGDNCGPVHSKYRKFVIVAVFTYHFISLPIFTQRIDDKTGMVKGRESPGEYAEVLDSSARATWALKYPGRAAPRCAGSAAGEWLWSVPAPDTGMAQSWARMADNATVWLTKPVAHQNRVACKLVSRLEKGSCELLLRWARDVYARALEVGLSKKYHLGGEVGGR